jgi:hypothetical protein
MSRTSEAASILDGMAADERAAFESGFLRSGQRTKEDFLDATHHLYKTAQEDDPRHRTWISGKTFAALERRNSQALKGLKG